MSHARKHITERRLRTPRMAAVAGILFAVCLAIGQTLVLSSPASTSVPVQTWIADYSQRISTGLGLLTFSAIFFLWFIGVVRDRLGHLEDQFFSTIFLGSGFLYLALKLTAAGLALGIITALNELPGGNGGDSFFVSLRHLVRFTDDLATRFSAAFMLSLATIALRAQIFNRWVVYVSYVLALLLLALGHFSAWSVMIFPLWVLLISIRILIRTPREID